MADLLAAIANDAEHMPSLLHSLGNVIKPQEPDVDGDVWGVGYYGDDRALIIRKPGELLNRRSFFDLACDVKSQVLVAFHSVSASETEHAPPHRWRRWLFGCVGDMATLAPLRPKIEDALPGFLKAEAGAAGGSALVFSMFLRELHDRGVLNDSAASGQLLSDAMERTIDAMSRLSLEAGVVAPDSAYVATNGRAIVVHRRGRPVHFKLQEGLEALPGGPPDRAMTDFQAVVRALKRFRAVVFATGVADPGTAWTEIADGRTAFVDRQLSVACCK